MGPWRAGGIQSMNEDDDIYEVGSRDMGLVPVGPGDYELRVKELLNE